MRTRLDAGVDAVVWIECGSCFGDGWNWPYRGRPTRKVTCVACAGRGKRQVLAISRSPEDRIVTPPAGWSAGATEGN